MSQKHRTEHLIVKYSLAHIINSIIPGIPITILFANFTTTIVSLRFNNISPELMISFLVSLVLMLCVLLHIINILFFRINVSDNQLTIKRLRSLYRPTHIPFDGIAHVTIARDEQNSISAYTLITLKGTKITLTRKMKGPDVLFYTLKKSNPEIFSNAGEDSLEHVVVKTSSEAKAVMIFFSIVLLSLSIFMIVAGASREFNSALVIAGSIILAYSLISTWIVILKYGFHLEVKEKTIHCTKTIFSDPISFELKSIKEVSFKKSYQRVDVHIVTADQTVKIGSQMFGYEQFIELLQINYPNLFE